MKRALPPGRSWPLKCRDFHACTATTPKTFSIYCAPSAIANARREEHNEPWSCCLFFLPVSPSSHESHLWLRRGLWTRGGKISRVSQRGLGVNHWIDFDIFLSKNTGVHPKVLLLIQGITLKLQPECLWQFKPPDLTAGCRCVQYANFKNQVLLKENRPYTAPLFVCF